MTGNPATAFSDQSIKNLMAEAVRELHNSDSARLDAELLLCNILQVERSHIYHRSGFTIPADRVHAFRLLLDQRKRGWPIAYLTGHREFWSLDLYVSPDTLIPRPETECLVEAVLSQVPADTDYRILDLGTGSGAIALALASERPACRITATDVCNFALAVAYANAERHGLDRVRFLQSDWFSGIQDTFDIIVSNPPYISSGDRHMQTGDVAHEPVLALDGGADGLNAIRTIISRAGNHLNPAGRLFIEHGFDQGGSVRELLIQQGYTAVNTLPDHAGLERVTFGRSGSRQCVT